MAGIGYLGPPGTFSAEALESYLRGGEAQSVPFPTVAEVIEAVQSGEVGRGIVPIENSIEGSVNATIDGLTFDADLLIEAEVIHQVRHCLLARAGTAAGDVSAVVSHPQATAQCRRFLRRRLPGVPVRAANSTAEAAVAVAASNEPLAAVATEMAAQIYDLQVLQRDIQDYEGNVTRFLVVGRDTSPPTGDDLTSMVCFIRENRPGSLLEILQEFASRRINLTKIESRPTKKVLGEYCFYIEIEGHAEDRQVSEALESLRAMLRELKLLGSYPAAPRRP